MAWYDSFARIYDRSLEDLYRPHREALAASLIGPFTAIVDVPSGTGQGWPSLLPLLEPQGVLVAVDLSPGMLRQAERRRAALDDARIRLLEADAAALDPVTLGLPDGADLVVCAMGLSVMPDPDAVVDAAWRLLRPGGTLAVMDAFAKRRVPSTWLVEWIARADLRRESWKLLEARAPTSVKWQGASASTFGGDLFIATATKPA